MIDDLMDVTDHHGERERSLVAMDLYVAIARPVEVTHPDIDTRHRRTRVQLDATRHLGGECQGARRHDRLGERPTTQLARGAFIATSVCASSR